MNKIITILFLILFLLARADLVLAERLIGSIRTKNLDTLNEIKINPNTNKLYVSAENALTIINTLTKKEIINYDGFLSGGIAINPETNKVYVTESSNESPHTTQGYNSVAVIDGLTDEIIAHIDVGKNPNTLAINPNTNKLYVANTSDNSVSVINTLTNTVVDTIKDLPSPFYPYAITINLETNKIYLIVENAIAVIDGSTNTVIKTIPVDGVPITAVVNPNINKIYVALDEGNVSIIDGETDRVVNTIKIFSSSSSFGGLDINLSTNRIYLADFFPDLLYIIDGSSDKLVSILSVGGGYNGPHSLVVDPNNNKIYFNRFDYISIVDAKVNNLRTNQIVGSSQESLKQLGQLYYEFGDTLDSIHLVARLQSLVEGIQKGLGYSTQKCTVNINSNLIKLETIISRSSESNCHTDSQCIPSGLLPAFQSSIEQLKQIINTNSNNNNISDICESN